MKTSWLKKAICIVFIIQLQITLNMIYYSGYYGDTDHYPEQLSGKPKGKYSFDHIKKEQNVPIYAVDTETCKVKQLDPWDPKYVESYFSFSPLKHCELPSLTYQIGDMVYVNLSLTKENQPYSEVASCSYHSISRKPKDDWHYFIGKTKTFEISKGFRMLHEFISLSCYSKNSSRLYLNYHVSADKNKIFNVKRASNSHNSEKKDAMGQHWNVIMFITDSVSHSEAIRTLPKTTKYVLDNLGGIAMQGYNRVRYSSFMNAMPFLTGHFAEEVLKSKRGRVPLDHLASERGPLDYLPLIYKNYSSDGYVTFHAEDGVPWQSLFNNKLYGMLDSPTDFYFRPLLMSLRHRNYNENECHKKMGETKLMIKYHEQFVSKFKNQKHFSLVWFSCFSHDSAEDTRRLDDIYIQYFKSIKDKGILDDTIVFFMSDHSRRFGKFVTTELGRLERNSPLMYLVLPPEFKKQYPIYFKNVKTNGRRLTTTFDVHETLLDIINISKYAIPARDPNERGQTWFKEISPFRTCTSAEIDIPYCSCQEGIRMEEDNDLAVAGAKFLVKALNEKLAECNVSHLCEKLELLRINEVFKMSAHTGNATIRETSLLLKIDFHTNPGEGHFLGVVKYLGGIHALNRSELLLDDNSNFIVVGYIHRINAYHIQSWCTKREPYPTVYCYCKEQRAI